MIGDSQNSCMMQQYIPREGDISNVRYSQRAYNWNSLTALSIVELLSAWSRCSLGSLLAAATMRLEAKVSL